MTSRHGIATSVGRHEAKAGIGRYRIALVLSLTLLAGACGGVSMPMGSADPETPLDLTGSIDGQQNPADVDISAQDRAIIAKAIATAREDGIAEPPFSWNNPISGNSGTIIALVDDTPANGTGCARFETTANTIGGVRAYNGVACQDLMRDWAVIGLTVKDGAADKAS
ncbi:RT0821/Lpp0805 family surface protein [Stappia sp.]|uniref:RT0821/Lpp0805 family surface protein n=1 Tax=Stappia sp. TaxID=1870903 RepID=UPI003A98FA59